MQTKGVKGKSSKAQPSLLLLLDSRDVGRELVGEESMRVTASVVEGGVSEKLQCGSRKFAICDLMSSGRSSGIMHL